MHAVGSDEYWYWLGHLVLREVPFIGPDSESSESETQEIQPRDPGLEPEQIAMVREALARLSDTQREVLENIYLKGMKAEEVAHALGVSRREIYSLMEKVRALIVSGAGPQSINE